MFITSIEYGASISGNAGCNNGNYDVPVTIRFDTGTGARWEWNFGLFPISGNGQALGITISGLSMARK